MKTLIVTLAIALAALGAAAVSSRPAEAVPPWGPLLSCPDVDGSGGVDLFNDIFTVAGAYGATYPNDDYLLLYDVAGGGTVDLFGDIFFVAGQFGATCPLLEQQVALATLATIQYKDCQDALADWYVQAT
ncbi:MAG: hypothetical protein Q8S13_11585, partial [Dehalococcoidia bacterium]|nr:hypothetical protein [Dehalococcoidia bacterium]